MVNHDSGFANWKEELIQELEAKPDTVSKGDSFVQYFLRHRYQLSNDDAVNATDMAGGGDYGIDGLIIEPAGDGNPPTELLCKGSTALLDCKCLPSMSSENSLMALKRLEMGSN